MWDLPGPGIEPVPPALAGGLLTTAPPGKPLTYMFYVYMYVLTFTLFFNPSGSPLFSDAMINNHLGWGILP